MSKKTPFTTYEQMKEEDDEVNCPINQTYVSMHYTHIHMQWQ